MHQKNHVLFPSLEISSRIAYCTMKPWSLRLWKLLFIKYYAWKQKLLFKFRKFRQNCKGEDHKQLLLLHICTSILGFSFIDSCNNHHASKGGGKQGSNHIFIQAFCGGRVDFVKNVSQVHYTSQMSLSYSQAYYAG